MFTEKPPWKSCKTPPPKYIRIEIKNKYGKKFYGFYIGDGKYLTTKDKELIKYPKQWRELPRPDRNWEDDNIVRLLFPGLYGGVYETRN